ncbi:glycoside hydrolase family 13 protein [Geodermatophilus sabuli]|uniref:Oligo-1,6-glucosidase n=1 Tax=Geodermatophilus sabuli TaxID=1564158 RepID=A0A285EBA2_9ACTN|nr:alpha-glucosidase [Geodermatophilus sabuli]MBB3085252.1 oligo-1,6-glucosidase [Geodermatophilus sabuli]SNX95341.1 oligo-1,6-glucosidase [Geodermatophilus sabuli]
MPEQSPWWTRAVVYQVYPRSFMDSDGDGIGDLGGVLQRLDHLADLGVDVLWLSPVYPSPQADNGYDISDYTEVDPLFGSLTQLDALIAALHERGMKLVMDLVVNHTSDAHPWFLESRSSKDSPKRDWYWWRPPRPGMAAGAPGAEPTNWHSFFSGPTWELDEASGEYYLHLFDRRQPDLNWENPEVRDAVYAMMRWWLDRGVDGFRMDVINMISKDVGPDGALHDGPPLPGVPYGDGSASYLCGPRIHEFLQEMHRAVFAGRREQLLLVGEMPGVTVEAARLFTDPAREEVDMVFQFEHVGLDFEGSKFSPRPLRLTDLKASFGRWQVGLADVGWNSLYWDNHDQPRAVSRFGDDSPECRRDSATCLATLLHLHRGTPYVYQGEELGMANAPFESLDDFRDVESLNHFAQAVAHGADPDTELAAMRRMGRDNARTPVQWDDSPNAGFTSGTPWIAVNPDHVRWNAAAQRADPTSVFAHHQRLIALRHESPVVALGDFTMVLPEHESVYAFTRSLDGETLFVVCNVSGHEYRLGELLPEVAGTELVLGNLPEGDPAVLRPWESRVLRS